MRYVGSTLLSGCGICETPESSARYFSISLWGKPKQYLAPWITSAVQLRCFEFLKRVLRFLAPVTIYISYFGGSNRIRIGVELPRNFLLSYFQWNDHNTKLRLYLRSLRECTGRVYEKFKEKGCVPNDWNLPRKGRGLPFFCSILRLMSQPAIGTIEQR